MRWLLIPRRPTCYGCLPGTSAPLRSRRSAPRACQIAMRDDWRDLLEAAAALGTTTIWLAFHGVDEEHDPLVNRPGAFAETCMAVERVHAAGLLVGCNVFLTRRTLPRVDLLADTLERLGIDEMGWAPANFYPTARRRR